MPRRSVGRYLVAAVALTILVKQTKNRSNQNNDSSNAEDNKQDQSSVATRQIISFPPIQVSSHPEEREYQQKREKYSWVQPASLIFSIAATIFAAWAAHGTSRQADAADESNRPWLYIEKMDAREINITKNQVITAKIDFFVSNLGHSVAKDIYVSTSMVLRNELNFDRTHDYCESVEIDDFDSAGKIAFPGKIIVLSGYAKPLQLTNNTNLNIVEIISCVVYRTTISKTTRKTGSIFILKDFNNRFPSITKNVQSIEDFPAGGYAN